MGDALAREVLPGTVLAFSAQVPELEGATLEWWLFQVSHSSLILRVSHGGTTFGKLYLGPTLAMNILPVMHNIHLRMATEQENSLYRATLKGRLAEYTGEEFRYSGFALRNGRFIIECSEGTFSIWAAYLSFQWAEDPQLGLSEERWPDGDPIWDIEAPLWTGGPLFPEL